MWLSSNKTVFTGTSGSLYLACGLYFADPWSKSSCCPIISPLRIRKGMQSEQDRKIVLSLCFQGEQKWQQCSCSWVIVPLETPRYIYIYLNSGQFINHTLFRFSLIMVFFSCLFLTHFTWIQYSKSFRETLYHFSFSLNV